MMEAIVVIIYVAMLVYGLVMSWRLVRAIERIADKLDQTRSHSLGTDSDERGHPCSTG